MYLTLQLSVPRSIIAGEEGEGVKTINHSRLALASHSTEPTSPLRACLPELKEGVDVNSLVFALAYHTLEFQASLPKGNRFFPLLNPSLTPAEALKGTAFVEFPTIQVMPKSDWEDKVSKGEVVILPFHHRQNTKAGVKRKAEDVENTESTPVSHEVVKPRPVSTVPLGLALADYGSDEEDSDAAE